MRLPSLRALHAFEAVARLGSVQAAAEELSVTPGAVSRQIKVLEDEMGVRLLERDGRGVRPTAAGRRCQDGLQSAFGEIAKTVERTRRYSGRRSRVLTVAVSSLFSASWLMSRLERFHNMALGVDVELRENVGETNNIDALGVDVVIGYGSLGPTAGVLADRLTVSQHPTVESVQCLIMSSSFKARYVWVASRR